MYSMQQTKNNVTSFIYKLVFNC